MYKSGLSYRQVSKIIGNSKTGVEYILHKYNILTERNIGDYDTRKYMINDAYFSNIDNEIKAYMIGFIMADGCVTDRNELQITIKNNDGYILYKFSESMNSNYPLKEVNDKYTSFSIKSKQISNDLSSLGIVPRKTKILEMPTIESNLMRHLIRGYFDGDGSVWYDKNANSYRMQILGTENVLQSISQFLVKSDTKLRSANKDNTVWRLSFAGNKQVTKLLSILYDDANIFLLRKYERYLKCKQLKDENEKYIIRRNSLGQYVCKNIS